MSGTAEGGRKARKTNIKKYGKNYYKRIGKEGGTKSTTGGFYYAKENGLTWHIEAGRKGGLISRRKAATKKTRKAVIKSRKYDGISASVGDLQ